MNFLSAVRQGVDRTGTQGLRRVYCGAKRAILFVWGAIGQIDSSLILSMYFVLMGIVLLLLNVRYVEQVTVLNLWSESVDVRLVMAVGFILLGWMIAYTKSLVLLTLGSMIAIVYGISAVAGVRSDLLSFEGLMVFAQNVPFALAILRTSYVEIQRRQDKQLYERTLAGVRAYAEVKSGKSAEGTGTK